MRLKDKLYNLTLHCYSYNGCKFYIIRYLEIIGIEVELRVVRLTYITLIHICLILEYIKQDFELLSDYIILYNVIAAMIDTF